MIHRHHCHLVDDVLLLLMEFVCVCGELLKRWIVCIACLLIVAVVISDSFAMCDVMVPAMVSAVMSLDSYLFVVRPENLLFCVYPPCSDVTVPKGRRRWYASWI